MEFNEMLEELYNRAFAVMEMKKTKRATDSFAIPDISHMFRTCYYEIFLNPMKQDIVFEYCPGRDEPEIYYYDQFYRKITGEKFILVKTNFGFVLFKGTQVYE